MSTDVDLAVVGLGGIGSAAAYWGARSGLNVVGFEQFELGHDRGASHDHSRIIRLSYHTPGYVELAKAAYDAWAALEADAGEALIVRSGGLDLFPADAAIPPGDYVDSLTAAGVPFEWLDGATIRARWPQFRIADDVHGLFQEAGGIAPAALATATHQRLTIAHGARLYGSTPIARIEPRAGEVVIDAGGETWRAGRVVVATDAWTAELLEPLGVPLPLTVLREQVTYFAADDARFAVDRLPVWIWMDDPSFYGFPVYGEAGAVKAAQDCGGRPTTARDRTFAVDDDELARVAGCMADLFGSEVGAPVRTKTCLYTLTPDRDFVLDAAPGAPEVLVALGAAHGFKFASWFGRTLVELARTGTTAHDLSAFRFDRPALTDRHYAPNWMV